MPTKLTWYGHATLGLEAGGYKLIVDPFFTGSPAAPIAPEAVIPIHYNTWDLLAQDAPSWAARVGKETKTKAVVLKPGESYSL